MRIKEITWRHRNDFHYTAECEHCGNVDKYGDGYADNFYCTQVVPNRHCCDCGLNSYGREAPIERVAGVASDVKGAPDHG